MLLMGAEPPTAKTHTDVSAFVSVHTRRTAASGHVGRAQRGCASLCVLLHKCALSGDEYVYVCL